MSTDEGGTADVPTVSQAIAAVIAELGGVGKNQRNKEQGYNFRGIDDVLKELHPLLGKHGVVFAPDVVEREYEERVSAKGTVGHCCHLHVMFRIYGPGGDHIRVSSWGEGLDYGDKATNKAMTAAFKYALFQVFAVSDPTEDGDAESPESGASAVTQPSRRERHSTVRAAPQPRTVDQGEAPFADPTTGEVKEGHGGIDVDALTMRQLTALLEERDLSVAGSSETKRQRLREFLAGQKGAAA